MIGGTDVRNYYGSNHSLLVSISDIDKRNIKIGKTVVKESFVQCALWRLYTVVQCMYIVPLLWSTRFILWSGNPGLSQTKLFFPTTLSIHVFWFSNFPSFLASSHSSSFFTLSLSLTLSCLDQTSHYHHPLCCSFVYSMFNVFTRLEKSRQF